MRSMLTIAGPIGDPNKRYKDSDDDKEAQKVRVLAFSKDLDAIMKSDDIKFSAIEAIGYNSLIYSEEFKQ